MARRNAKQRLQLPDVLDLDAAGPLAEAFLARRGANLAVDAARVQRLGALCLQVLVSADATWRADGKSLNLVDASPEFLESLRLFGVAPDGLALEGAA